MADDGFMRFGENGGSSANYEPNSLNGPAQQMKYAKPQKLALSGAVGRYDQRSYPNEDFQRAGDRYRLQSSVEQDRLVDNIVDRMKNLRRKIKLRQLAHFKKADVEFGDRLTRGFGLTDPGDLKAEALTTN
jgi:catalase